MKVLMGRECKGVPAWTVGLVISGLAPLLLAACLAPVTTTPTPTSAPLPPPVTVDLSSKTDSQGVLLETVRITSSDGMLTATLPAGSRVLDAIGRPVRSLTLTPYRPVGAFVAGSLGHFPTSGLVAGLAYKWDDSVTWGTITPDGAFTVSYGTPPESPRISPDRPTIGVLWNERLYWDWAELSVPLTIDPVARTITWAEPRFHDIAVIYWYADVRHDMIVPPPAPTPQATQPPP